MCLCVWFIQVKYQINNLKFYSSEVSVKQNWAAQKSGSSENSTKTLIFCRSNFVQKYISI